MRRLPRELDPSHAHEGGAPSDEASASHGRGRRRRHLHPPPGRASRAGRRHRKAGALPQRSRRPFRTRLGAAWFRASGASHLRRLRPVRLARRLRREFLALWAEGMRRLANDQTLYDLGLPPKDDPFFYPDMDVLNAMVGPAIAVDSFVLADGSTAAYWPFRDVRIKNARALGGRIRRRVTSVPPPPHPHEALERSRRSEPLFAPDESASLRRGRRSPSPSGTDSTSASDRSRRPARPLLRRATGWCAPKGAGKARTQGALGARAAGQSLRLRMPVRLQPVGPGARWLSLVSRTD